MPFDPRFVSPGYAVATTLQDILKQRRIDERQQMLDLMTGEQHEQNIALSKARDLRETAQDKRETEAAIREQIEFDVKALGPGAVYGDLSPAAQDYVRTAGIFQPAETPSVSTTISVEPGRTSGYTGDDPYAPVVVPDDGSEEVPQAPVLVEPVVESGVEPGVPVIPQGLEEGDFTGEAPMSPEEQDELGAALRAEPIVEGTTFTEPTQEFTYRGTAAERRQEDIYNQLMDQPMDTRQASALLASLGMPYNPGLAAPVPLYTISPTGVVTKHPPVDPQSPVVPFYGSRAAAQGLTVDRPVLYDLLDPVSGQRVGQERLGPWDHERWAELLSRFDVRVAARVPQPAAGADVPVAAFENVQEAMQTWTYASGLSGAAREQNLEAAQRGYASALNNIMFMFAPGMPTLRNIARDVIMDPDLSQVALDVDQLSQHERFLELTGQHEGGRALTAQEWRDLQNLISIGMTGTFAPSPLQIGPFQEEPSEGAIPFLPFTPR